ncbi:competence protein CoiA family protein [Bacillus sp. B15-48]|uniref:competence protein CoiA n=1 Tax=Bacillus sp. B15-48 TaxID=1548601 RepID=UPI00193F1EF5|nr:competence protein CoiA family protein [Bacillus sp. B15-48]MBM4764251.1 competence protein CoiA [Bacillus sp. B15-48]
MLVACRKNGEKLSLGDHFDKDELVQSRKKEEFFCPECRERVVLKLGDKRIWHFSHQKGSNCPSKYDRESSYHLSGKLQLYQWLNKRTTKAQLEQYFHTCKQRADIAFEWNRQLFSIEFQCSPIREELFINRTEGYQSNRITPIWIIGGNQINRLASNLFSFNHFQYLFLRRQDTRWFVIAYCPDVNQFIFLHDLLPISPKKVLASMTILPKYEIDIYQLLHLVPLKRLPLSCWIHELQKLKTSYYSYPDFSQRTFLETLYKNGLNLLTFPSEIGLPVRSSPFIETSPLVWQTFLYLDILRHLKTGNIFSYSNIYHAFLIRMNKQEIKIRQFPLVDHGSYELAIREYLYLLVKMDILTQIDENRYAMNRPFKIPLNTEGQVENEKQFYHNNEKMIYESL